MQSTVRKSRIEDPIKSKNFMEFKRLCDLIAYTRKDDDELELKEALDTDGDINYQDPNDGCTVLHLAGQLRRYLPEIIMETLIDNGADPTITNNKDQTVVHFVLNRYDFRPSELSTKRYIDYILNFVHVQNENTTNYADVNGVSHFHAACMVDDMKIVNFFLNNGVDLNQAVKMDSPKYPGYTSLHFAVEYGYVELVDRLLDHGADLLKDSKGMTPLHLLIRRIMEIVQRLNFDRKKHPEGILREVETNERIIKSILSKTDETTIDRLGLFPFHVMCAVRDDSRNFTRNDISKCINFDSSFWPGYTALHFAARFDIDTVKLLLEKGADVEAKDAYEVTPFDLCVGRYSAKDIHSIISSHNVWRNILLSDGKTKVLELVLAMQNSKDLIKFLAERNINDLSIPRDSPLWSGFTILHLAVTLSKKCTRSQIAQSSSLFGLKRDKFELVPNLLVEVCLNSGADVIAQDSNGSTPIHLAFRRMDLDSMYVLLERCDGKSNPTDKDNLSLLHIACAVEDENLVEKLLASGADVNVAVKSSFQWDPELRYFHNLNSGEQLHVWPGSTPLHVAMTMWSRKIVTLLMKSGADLNGKDANGLAPLHRTLTRPCVHRRLINDGFLSRFITRDCAIDGISYLHIAVVYRYPIVAKKLLKLGANVNSTIVEKTVMPSNALNYFEGDTPLHFMGRYSAGRSEILRLLVRWGADVLAKNSKGCSPIFMILEDSRWLKCYLSAMSRDDKKRLVDEMGLTKLHLACRLCDVKMMKKYLRKGAKVNARVRDDSGIWPGYTPLHVLVKYDSSLYEDELEKMCVAVRLLLKNGADVMIADAKGETPLMMNIPNNHIEKRPAHIEILWEKLRNSTVNPVSHEGISHFHLACIRQDVALMETFLKLGADPYQRIDHSSKFYPDYTPLHFALREVILNHYCSLSHNNSPISGSSVDYHPIQYNPKLKKINNKIPRRQSYYRRFRRLCLMRRISVSKWMRGLHRSNSVNSLPAAL